MNEAEKSTAVRNRRASQRREARRSLRIECRKGASGLGKDMAGSVLDVSEDGIRLMLKEQMPAKQEMEIIIITDGGRQPIKRLANVVWIVTTEEKQFCAGLKFQKRIPYAEVSRLGRP